MLMRTFAVVAAGLLVAGCGDPGQSTSPTSPSALASGAVSGVPAAASTAAGAADVQLPFHSEGAWSKNMLPPDARCVRPAPAPHAFLWVSEITGTATSTHLGTGPFDAVLCVYGRLINPQAPPGPGSNGVPAGWFVESAVWKAANGDRLIGAGALTGFTAPPGTPGMKFIETYHFLDGGTGRFQYAEGDVTSYVSPGGEVVMDGWIRYGKKEK